MKIRYFLPFAVDDNLWSIHYCGLSLVRLHDRLFASGLAKQTVLMSENRLEGVVYHGTRPEVTEDRQVLPNSLV